MAVASIKQKKKTVPVKQSKKKIVKKTRLVKSQRKFSTKLLIGTAILFIMLFVIVFFSSQQQILRGNAAQPVTSPIVPTFGTIGDCHTNGTCPKDSPTLNGNNNSVGNSTNAVSPTVQPPCVSTQNAQTSIMSKHGKSKGGNSNSMQLILQFLQQLLLLLEQLLGGNTTTPTPITTQPTQAVTPSQGAQPIISIQPTQGVQPTAVPGPTALPCPPSPTSASAPQPSSTSPAPTGTTGNIVPVGVAGNWTLTFDDEFNSTSVDTSKWTIEGPRAPNNVQEFACYSPSAVSESGGSLNLALLNTSCSAGGKTYQYTGAQMDTTKDFTQTYGFYEARVWSDGSNGTVANWGAWWLVGTKWPQDGEVDIFEGFHGTAGYHFEYAPSGTAIWQGTQASGDYTGWHTYAVNWQPSGLTFYYDGKKMGSTFTTGVPTVALHLMLDLTTAPQNNVGGPVQVPATQKVDYVRVWK